MSAEWQFIVTLNEQMRPLRNPVDIRDVAIRLTGEHLQASRVSYAYVDGDEYVISRCYANGVEPIAGRGPLARIGREIVETYRRGETVVVNDARSDPRLTEDERTTWCARETVALVGVPLIKDGRWLATFNVHSTTARHWSPDQLALIEVAAERAWGMGERVRAEEALSRGESRQALLRRLSETVRPLSDPAQIAEAACRLIGTHLRVNRAVHVEIDGDECTPSEGYVDGVPPLPRRFAWRELANSRTAEILRSGTLISNDTSIEGHTPTERVALNALRIGAYICPVLVKDGRFIAAFAIHSAQPRIWTADEIDLVTEVADRIWATLDHRRAEAGLKANEGRLAFLLELNDAIRPLKDSKAVQDTSARLLAEHLNVSRAGYAVIDAQGLVVRYQHARGVAPLPERGPAMTFGAALHDAYMRGETVVVHDTATDARLTDADRALMKRHEMAAYVSVRLIKDGVSVAAFGVSHVTPRQWTSTEIALVRDVAERTWETTERARAEAALLAYEAQFHHALAVAGAGCWTWDPRSRDVVWDDTLRARYDLAPGETPLIDTFFTRVHPEDRSRLQADTQEILESRDRWETTYRFVQPDGTVRWMQSMGHALRNESGQVVKLTGFELDIDDRRRIEAASHARREEEHERELARLLETSTQGVVSVDQHGTIVTVNQTIERMFGWARDQLIGQPLELLLPSAFRDSHARHRINYFAAPRPRPMGGGLYLVGQRHDGSTFPIEVGLNHVVTAGGTRAYAFITDITERRRAALALQQRTSELEERTKQLSQMAWDLTLAEHHAREQIARTLHDGLQQLLVIVSLNLEMQLKRDSDSGEPPNPVLVDARHHLDEAIAAARSLSRELFPPVLHRSGLPSALEWLATWMREKYRLEVALAVEPAADTSRSDLRTLLFESVRELLFNAVKHAKTDRVTLHLSIDRDDRLCVTVADQGIGFDPQSLDDRLKSGQAGWGLFSIRERLTLLGGRFEIESAPGRGTRIRMVAPRATAKEIDTRVPAAGRQPLVEPSMAATKRTLRDALRILIVDDHAAVRNALSQILGGRPQLRVVGEAVDGIDAVVQTRRLLPDVILMDVMMPQMDGIEATERIHHEFPDIQILGLSMQARSEHVHAIERAGAAGFFVKGVDTQPLLDRLMGLHASRCGAAS